MDVLEEMGTESAAYYLLNIQEHVQECLDMVSQRSAKDGTDRPSLQLAWEGARVSLSRERQR